MSLLILSPQLVRSPQFPLGLLRAQVKYLQRFQVVLLRIKVDVAGHHTLPRSLFHQLCLVRLIAFQLMGRVNPSQKFLCGEFPTQVFHPD